jgi:hypothetical protein
MYSTPLPSQSSPSYLASIHWVPSQVPSAWGAGRGGVLSLSYSSDLMREGQILWLIGTGCVADPDQGSGAFVDPWIRTGRIRLKNNPEPGSGMNIPNLVFEYLVSVFGLKYLNPLMRIRIRDLVYPGSGIRDGKNWIRDPGYTSRIRNTSWYWYSYVNY